MAAVTLLDVLKQLEHSALIAVQSKNAVVDVITGQKVLGNAVYDGHCMSLRTNVDAYG